MAGKVLDAIRGTLSTGVFSLSHLEVSPMQKIGFYVLPLLVVLLACATAAIAQDEEIEAYTKTWSAFPQIVNNFILSVVYLGIYAASALIPMGYLKIYNGFETDMFYWIGALWLGGMAINALTHAMFPSHAVAVVLAIPLIFGWSLLMNTRDFADISFGDAWKIAAITAVVCAPYFGPTWRILPPA